MRSEEEKEVNLEWMNEVDYYDAQHTWSWPNYTRRHTTSSRNTTQYISAPKQDRSNRVRTITPVRSTPKEIAPRFLLACLILNTRSADKPVRSTPKEIAPRFLLACLILNTRSAEECGPVSNSAAAAEECGPVSNSNSYVHGRRVRPCVELVCRHDAG